MNLKEGPGRIYIIDEIRGLAILGMLVIHGMLYYEMVFGGSLAFAHTSVFRFFAVAGGGLFIFISGVSCSFSKNNIRRGLIAFGFGILISLATLFAWKILGFTDTFVFFGILHLLGFSMILFGLVETQAKRARPLPAMVFSGMLFAVSWLMVYHRLWRLELFSLAPFQALYDRNLLYLAGYPNPSVMPVVDFYPVLPWTLLFFAGAFLGIWMVRQRLPHFFHKEHVRPLIFCGQHSLVIYLLHPLVLYPLMLGARQIALM